MTHFPTFLLGPTAAGKSEIALRLAEEDNAALLSLDSMQVYRGLDLGTGKPTPAEQTRIPHGALDLVDWWEPFDTARYLEAAAIFLHKQMEASRPVYIVGGTGLYFRALTRGLSEAPPAPEALREELRALPLPELQRRLRAADPAQEQEAAFDWQNPRRVQRALEVIESTGLPLREWHRQTATAPIILHSRAIHLTREREDLRARIARRTETMLEKGWIDEVRARIAERSLAEMRECAAIGYSVLAAEIERGGLPSSTFVPEKGRQTIVDQTRQYAKRQLTWFKRESNLETLMIPPGEPSTQTALRLRSLLGSHA